MIIIQKEISKNLALFYFIILAFVYCAPIILTGRPYIDDLGRTLYGYSGWGLNGRPLSDLIMTIMSVGGMLVDISPITQLISIIALCFALYFYANKNLKDISFLGVAITSFLFIANPFYIENLSYRYDSLPMALSMVMLMLPYTISLKGAIYHIFSVIFIVASLALYQASIGLFVILAVMEIVAVKSYLGNKNVFKSILIRMGHLTLAFILYKIFIAAKFVSGDYNITHSETLPLSLSSLPIFSENIVRVKWLLNSYISSIPLAIKFLFVSSVIYSTVKHISKLIKTGYRNNIASILVISTSPILVVIFALAPLVILKSPVFAPRVMLSLSGAIMLFSFLIFSQIKSRSIKLIIISPIIWISIVYSYSFSTSSKSQADLDSLISSSIYQDASRSGKDLKYVNVLGEMPKSPQLLISESKFPLMSKLVPIYLSYDWIWGAELLNHYGMKLEYKVLGDVRDNMMCSADVISKTKDYNLYYKENILFIDFKKIKC